MPHAPLSPVLRHIRKLAGTPGAEARSDACLLHSFTHDHDEAAFAALVRRHGGLVLGVCRRVLRHRQDAEDAFQATFLILARHAASIRHTEAVASWLYRLAYRTAASAGAAMAKRHTRDRTAAHRPPAEPPSEAAWREMEAILHEELARLPDKYRAPFVLCCLEGKSGTDAAHALGWTEGTVRGRLTQARRLLQQRLTRRGIELSAMLCAAVLSRDAVSAAVPCRLLASTVVAARGLLTGAAVATGTVSATTAVLLREVTKTMFTTKCKTVTALLLTLSLLAGAGALLHRALAHATEIAVPVSASATAPTPISEGGLRQGTEPLPAGTVMRLGTTRLRPGGSVEQLVFSPDGTKLASWSSEMYVTDALCVWETRTGRLLRRFDMRGAKVWALAWLADGRGVAVIDTQEPAGSPLVWEFTDPKAAAPKTAPGAAMDLRAVAPGLPAPAADNEADACYAVSPDGRTLAVGRAGAHEKPRPILLRPLKVGVRVSELPAARELARQPGNCGRLLFTPDGRKLVAFDAAPQAGGREADRQRVVVWNVATGKETTGFTAPRPAENGDRPAVAVSDRTLAIGLEDGGTSLWDLATGRERRLATGHDSKRPGGGYGTFAVAFGPGGKALATAGRDEVVKLWDTATGRHLRTLSRHFSWIEALTFAPAGQTVASAGQDGEIRLWDPATGADACPLPGHHYAVNRVALSPDGRTALTAGWDATLRWWDTASGRERRTVHLPGVMEGLAVSPDGQTVLGTVHDRLRTWDLATGREITPPDLPRGVKVGPLAFTPDRRRLVTASGPHVSVWEWPALKVARTLDLPKPATRPGENESQSVAVSPDGRLLVTVAHRSWYREEKGLRFGYGADGVVDVWDLATGKRARRLVESQSVLTSAVFTADGRVVLIGGVGKIPAEAGRSAKQFSGPVAVLDPLAARWLRSFAHPPPTPGVGLRYPGGTGLAPDGRTLYVAYNTGEIMVFEVATGGLRRTLAGHRGYVGGLGFSPDGRRVISGSHDATALVWDVTLAGAAAPRKVPLTAAEAEKRWAKAGEPDARAAFAALAELATAPDVAVALVRRELKPVPAGPTDADLDRIFADLDSPRFATREQAARRLAALREAAVPGVRKRLSGDVGPEVRRRALAFLERFDPRELTPARLRQLRAVELLEGIGTPPACALLSDLAKGLAGAPLTADAAAALARLHRQ
jgi:RNA polymerase sigma factor (sigma-70 family)